jgi:hypothetical protein
MNTNSKIAVALVTTALIAGLALLPGNFASASNFEGDTFEDEVGVGGSGGAGGSAIGQGGAGGAGGTGVDDSEAAAAEEPDDGDGNGNGNGDE